MSKKLPTKTRKRKNYRLRKSVRRTLGALFLISAIVLMWNNCFANSLRIFVFMFITDQVLWSMLFKIISLAGFGEN